MCRRHRNLFHYTVHQQLGEVRLGSRTARDTLAEAIGLMSVRADYKLEPLPIRSVISKPVATPDVAVVDLNQAGVRYAIKIGLQSMRVGNDHRLPGG